LTKVLLVLLTLTLLPRSAGAGAPSPGRLVRPSDTSLRIRLEKAHLVRGEPVDVNALASGPGKVSAADHYNSGMALSMTGRYTQASRAFHSALTGSAPGSETRLQALGRFLEMSPYNPDLDLPSLSGEERQHLGPELAMALSGYLADRGDRAGALDILQKAVFTDPEEQVVSGILTASHLAALNQRDASARLMGRTEDNESTPLADLLFLMKGYHYLQAGLPDRSRSSFLAIVPSSPYYPEALLGKAWSLIRDGDMVGANIALEELVERHRYSPAADEGVLDLALTYRELGLYEKAGSALSSHLDRLREKRNWLLGLREADLLAGRDLILLLEEAIDGNISDGDLLLRTPQFAREWITVLASDPVVRHTTALRNGLRFAEDKVSRLREKLDADSERTRREIDWIKHDIARVRLNGDRLEEIRDRLTFIGEELSATLQNLPLDAFAGEKALALISRTRELKARLSLMENSLEKAERFGTFAGKLTGTVTASEKEKQLTWIREQAYERILPSRQTLESLRNSLAALEGHIWLEVKGAAVELEKKTSFRVTSGRARAAQAAGDNSEAIRILTDKQHVLEALTLTLIKRKRDLDTTISQRLALLGQRIEEARAGRILTLAAQTAGQIKEAEAKTLFTSADIEISRMESTVRSLQEMVR